MIIIALGANIPGPYGSAGAALNQALRVLEERGIRVVKASRQWVSEPVPASDHPWYRNAVAVVETDLPSQVLVLLLKDIEKDFGRTEGEKNAPRPLDLDLIAYNGDVITEKDLIVPHPRLQERAFVLLPLQEIAPDWRHPVLNKPLKELIAGLPPGQKLSPLEEAA